MQAKDVNDDLVNASIVKTPTLCTMAPHFATIPPASQAHSSS
jgi:hypothetical protein